MVVTVNLGRPTAGVTLGWGLSNVAQRIRNDEEVI